MPTLPGRVGAALGAALVLALSLPLLALATSASVADLMAGVQDPVFAPALWLSLKTSLLSLTLVCLLGTPLAWWLAASRSKLCRSIELLVQLPVVIPPAVVGVALLQTFGRRGLLGPALAALDLSLPFTPYAVVIAQLVVSAPFYVQAAANAFRKVSGDSLLVARTLGASGAAAFFRVSVPVALPGLVAGASLAWARSLGEFGATLLFAGNSPGSTQTMPLAIFSALESDVEVALALSLVLTAFGALALVTLQATRGLWLRVAGAYPAQDSSYGSYDR